MASETEKAKMRAYYAEHKSEINAANRANYIKRRDDYLAKNHEYSKANRDLLNKAKRLWRLVNHEAHVAQKRARRARSNGAEGRYTKQDLDLIWEAQNGRCANPKCAIEMKIYRGNNRSDRATVDHIVALTSGGSNWPENIQWLCLSCNASKGNRDHFEWAATVGVALQVTDRMLSRPGGERYAVGSVPIKPDFSVFGV